MARKATTPAQEEVKHDNTSLLYNSWEERSNEERIASMNNYAKIMLAGAMKTHNADWQKDMSKEQIDNSIPYNASTGQCYSGVTSMLLRSAVTMNGYENSDFLTMKQANLLGGKLKKELDENGKVKTTANGKDQYVKGVKVAMYKTYEYQPKLDSNGKQIYITDKNGNEKPAQEKVYLKEPKLETFTLYHSSQFDNLDKSKLVERDLSAVKAYRERNADKGYDIRPKIDALGMGTMASADINNFMTSENKGIDYNKIQHQRVNNQRVEPVKEKGREL